MASCRGADTREILARDFGHGPLDFIKKYHIQDDNLRMLGDVVDSEQCAALALHQPISAPRHVAEHHRWTKAA